MKKLLMIFCCFIMLMLTGCGSTEFKFLYNKSEIVRVEIVVLEENSIDFPRTTTIAIVDDLEMFLSDFSCLKCYSVRNDPEGVYPGDIAIKFQFFNQEFQLVTYNGQAKYTYSDYYNGYYFNQYSGYYYFDQQEFDDLIEKYINMHK